MQSKSTPTPEFVAYLIEESRHDGGKPFWHRVGNVWPNKQGKGYTLVIPPGMTIAGRVILIPPRLDDE